jgi:hypothetical protein
MKLTTMEDVRRELWRLLDEMMGDAPTGTVVPSGKLLAAFRQLELTDQLRSEIFETGLSEILHRVIMKKD